MADGSGAGQDRVTLELAHLYYTPEPTVLHEIDEEANEVRFLADGELVAVLTGATTFDPDDIEVRIVGIIVTEDAYY